MSEDNPAADHAFVDEDAKRHDLERNLKSGVTWMRGLFMLISCLLISVASAVGTLIVILGFFWVLFNPLGKKYCAM